MRDKISTLFAPMTVTTIARILGCLFWALSLTVNAQIPVFTTQQTQNLPNGELMVLGFSAKGSPVHSDHALWTWDSTAYQLLRFSSSGQLLQDYDLTALVAEQNPFHFGWLEHLCFQWVDSTVMYLYGSEMGYGHFPFAFRSTDKAESWEPVIFKNDSARISRMNFRMTENSLVMFDSSHGVLMQAERTKRDKLRLVVLETKDGWETYKQRRVALEGLDPTYLNKLEYSLIHNKEIEIEAVGHPESMVFRSVDQAATFQPTFIQEILD